MTGCIFAMSSVEFNIAQTEFETNSCRTRLDNNSVQYRDLHVNLRSWRLRVFETRNTSLVCGIHRVRGEHVERAAVVCGRVLTGIHRGGNRDLPLRDVVCVRFLTGIHRRSHFCCPTRTIVRIRVLTGIHRRSHFLNNIKLFRTKAIDKDF